MKKLFGRWAPIYNVTDLFISRIRPKVVEFLNAKSNSKVLDIATGTGKQAFAFAKKGYNVIGIDLSEDMLKVATKKSKYKNVKFEVTDAANMPFKSDHFDVTCISFALHDIPLSIRKKVLAEMIRVTKLNGLITVVDYTLPKNNISRWLVYHFVKLYESKYYPEFIKSDLKALLREQGIKIEEELTVLFGAVIIFKGMK
jgi:demethylmenaquinone methyltransferase/2-methoxy-6-polyprenyl-1,4-benzoquinol methylase